MQRCLIWLAEFEQGKGLPEGGVLNLLLNIYPDIFHNTATVTLSALSLCKIFYSALSIIDCDIHHFQNQTDVFLENRPFFFL